MKTTFLMCGRPQASEEFIGCVCGRCDKVAGDVDAEMLLASRFGAR